MIERPEKIEHYNKSFQILLNDSIYHLFILNELNHKELIEKYKDDMSATLARASIINSIFLLECAANALLYSLEMSSKFNSDIEKLPAISKFEFFIKSIKEEDIFDRGCKEIQLISELKLLRDTYVHPKILKITYERCPDNRYQMKSSIKNHTQINKNPFLWGEYDAIIALKSICNFFNKYFLEWCDFSVEHILDLLFSNHQTSPYEALGKHSIDLAGNLDKAREKWGIDFSFLGK